MGQLIKDASIVVALVGLDGPRIKQLTERLTTSGGHDPGHVSVLPYDRLQDCEEAVRDKRINAICVAVEKYQAQALTCFVAEIRVTAPLVSFCLMGTDEVLTKLPGHRPAWKERFAHYYKLRTDLTEADFRENAGMVRDLFVADAVKSRALGHLDTTPGGVIQIRSPRPYGFWLVITASLMAAFVGGSIGPILDRVLPDKAGRDGTATPSLNPPPSAQPGSGQPR